jgi:hypothetical protein
MTLNRFSRMALIMFALLGMAACMTPNKYHGKYKNCADGSCPMGSKCDDKSSCSKSSCCPHSKDNKIGTSAAMTAEMHNEMAKVHQEAAECLKSGKSNEECVSKNAMAGHPMIAAQGTKNLDQCMEKMKNKKMDEKGINLMKECLSGETAKP